MRQRPTPHPGVLESKSGLDFSVLLAIIGTLWLQPAGIKFLSFAKGST